ncbi:MAG: four helix bundle protein [Chitinispirillaceae bacterium]|nr:four helix bundle protein [Chitinispirillaceae bacterium]
MSNAEIVVDAARRFVSILDDYTAGMPRDRKFTIGDRLITRALLLLETTVEAYYRPRALKKSSIAEANIHCEIIRQLLRLLFEKGYHNVKKHEYYSRELDAIGRSLGGWCRSLD